MITRSNVPRVVVLFALGCGDLDPGGGASESGDSSSDDGSESPVTFEPTSQPDDSGSFTVSDPTLSDDGPDDGPLDDGPLDDGCIPRQCGVEIACGVADDGCGEPLDCGPCGEGTPVDGILPVRMIPDHTRGTLLVTVAATSPEHANELVVVDPDSATIIYSAFVGSDPSSLAISDDGSIVWVGLDGSQEIRRVSIGDDGPAAETSVDLPPGDLEGAVAGPMVVLPGTTDSVAVSMHAWGFSPSFTGLVVIDDGVPRPMQTPGHTGAARLTGGPEGWLYGFNNLHTGFEFYAVEVQDDGPVATDFAGIVDGFDTDIVYADGFVFATDGAVIDVSVPAAPDLAGTFPHFGAIVPDVAGGRVLMLSPPDFGAMNMTVRELDLATFTQTGSAGFMTIADVAIIDFAAPDEDTLAVVLGDWVTQTRQLLLFANPFP